MLLVCALAASLLEHPRAASGAVPLLAAIARKSPCCLNLSGHWRPALPLLAEMYRTSAYAELDRKREGWLRNSSAPELLVFHDDRGMPTIDTFDVSSVLRGRVVLFIGDSVSRVQAVNLVILASSSVDGRSRRVDKTTRAVHDQNESPTA
eukprot:2043287-Prymnesium_polylepis.1